MRESLSTIMSPDGRNVRWKNTRSSGVSGFAITHAKYDVKCAAQKIRQWFEMAREDDSEAKNVPTIQEL